MIFVFHQFTIPYFNDDGDSTVITLKRRWDLYCVLSFSRVNSLAGSVVKNGSFKVRDDIILFRSEIVFGRLTSLGISQRVVAWRSQFWHESRCVHPLSSDVSR